MNQNLHVNKANFHMKDFALGLALKQRRNATRKSPFDDGKPTADQWDFQLCRATLPRHSPRPPLRPPPPPHPGHRNSHYLRFPACSRDHPSAWSSRPEDVSGRCGRCD